MVREFKVGDLVLYGTNPDFRYLLELMPANIPGYFNYQIVQGLGKYWLSSTPRHESHWLLSFEDLARNVVY